MEGGHKHGASLGREGDQLREPRWLCAGTLASRLLHGGRSLAVWVQVPALPLASCVTCSMLINLSGSLLCKMKMTIVAVSQGTQRCQHWMKPVRLLAC